MGIYCPRCGEPWEVFHVFHEMSIDERADLLTGRGCSRECSEQSPADNERTAKAQVALELCGSDLDGAVAMMEDFSI